MLELLLKSLRPAHPKLSVGSTPYNKSQQSIFPTFISPINFHHYNLFQYQNKIRMRIEAKQLRDEDFTPRDIRKRSCYRKISEEIKKLMARLYYVQHVKMSKLVKKYNISFSTVTDILKRYDQNGERLPRPAHLQNKSRKRMDSNHTQLKQENTNEGKPEMLDPEPFLELESPNNPEYVFYTN